MKFTSVYQRCRKAAGVLVHVVVVLLFSGPLCRTQERAPFVFYPEPKAAWTSDASVGLRVLAVPRDISEEELNRAPAVDVQFAIGLPLQSSLAFATDLQIVTNQFRAGMRFAQCLGPLCIAAGDDVSYWFGVMDFEGFDNSMHGWMNYPNITLGYMLSDVRISLRGELLYSLSQRSYAGENELSFSKTRRVGEAITFTLEQPLLRNMHVVLGVRLSSTEFHHQTWFAFSAFKRKLLYSELLFAVLL